MDYDPRALPVPHGYELSADDRRLLRSRPPRRALAWAAAAFGPSARVRSARSRDGGSHSAIHVVTIDDGSGRAHRCVLRRYVRPNVLAEEPDLAAQEAVALRVAALGSLATPDLIAVDPTGEAAGTPSVLMSVVPGRIEWAPANLDRYLARLAEPLLAISAITVPPTITIRSYRPYRPSAHTGARGTTRLPARVWDAARALFEQPPPLPDRLFIHRDYHPGNVLWRHNMVSGVIDWQSVSIGAPEADVAHCRANLHSHFGRGAADRFLEHWQRISGRSEFSPYWDIAVVMSLGSRDARQTPWLDEFVAAAIARR